MLHRLQAVFHVSSAEILCAGSLRADPTLEGNSRRLRAGYARGRAGPLLTHPNQPVKTFVLFLAHTIENLYIK